MIALPPLPLLASAGIKKIYADCETEGLRWTHQFGGELTFSADERPDVQRILRHAHVTLEDEP